MTGPEFAQAHGNDSTNWPGADFDALINLVDIDLHNLRTRNKQKPTPKPSDLTTAA